MAKELFYNPLRPGNMFAYSCCNSFSFFVKSFEPFDAFFFENFDHVIFQSRPKNLHPKTCENYILRLLQQIEY